MFKKRGSESEPTITPIPEFASSQNEQTRELDWGIGILGGRVYELDRDERPIREIASGHLVRITLRYRGQGPMLVCFDSPTQAEAVAMTKALEAERTVREARQAEASRAGELAQLEIEARQREAEADSIRQKAKELGA